MKSGFVSTLKQSFQLLKTYFKEVVFIAFLNVVLAYAAAFLNTFLFTNIDKVIALLLSLLTNTLFFALNTSIITIFMVNKDSGNNLEPLKLIEYVIKRLIPVIITIILYELIILLGLLIFIIPSLIFALEYSQAVNFALIDGDNPLKALKRSVQVTKGKRMQLFGLLALFGFLYWIISLSTKIFPIPKFVDTLMTSIIVNITIIVNYVIWKTLKENPKPQIQDAPVKDSTAKKIVMSVLVVIVGFLLSIITTTLLIRFFSLAGPDYFNNLILFFTIIISAGMIFYIWKIKNK